MTQEVVMILCGQPVHKLVMRQAAFRQYVAVDISVTVGSHVIFRHVQVTHLQRLRHHVVDVGCAVDGSTDTVTDKPAKQEYDDDGDDGAYKYEDCYWRRVVVDTLGIEPFVVNSL